MATWYDNKPATTDDIDDGVGYIENNLEYLHTLAENHYKSLSDTSEDIGKDACYFPDPTASDVTDAETNVVITRNSGGSFTAQGTIRAVVYYEVFDTMADAA